ncbi:ADP-ribosylglycohydrolase family protein [Metabacillus indicus]|uniref:ADP-ribosylglycohydrolase family protein n=1 Tax=Metabacillus indicus TaxID=246786 RepID=UPI002A04DE66|nr:ADP-ribosylglycohydrolase family protein [Metabacillus indicus]MDX8291234.1 ADP-ribosylglycohydrolase family protein [Metabacillus indicus]
MLIPEDYLERVYAGFLGMNAGIRLGAPVEPLEWTYERIHDVYGEINGYLKDYNVFSADDDANGPAFFIRALYDDAKDRELTAEDVGRAWLNYTRHGIGMFWWGGEGISTEHTAYLNLEKGIQPPYSGSAEKNGLTLAEQIGGQIFVDTWGLLFPGHPEKAADYAAKAASVSHDKNGIYGARFIAACIAAAFNASDIHEVIARALTTIPEESTYAKIAGEVLDFHWEHPGDFRACRDFLEVNWGYDKYPGVCHIIPNAGVCILAMLYGEGSFARTIEIAAMCGWDTDCNAGKIGTVAGVLYGTRSIPEHYRKPINDFIVLSSVSGYLNIMDIPSFAKELALLGFRLAGEEAPDPLVKSYKKENLYFDFVLPGSTHGFQTDFPFKLFLRHCADMGFKTNGSLEIFIDRMIEGESGKVFYKPFHRRKEFNDEKYKPSFSPKICSGQRVSMKVFADKWQGEDIVLTPYVRNTFTEENLKLQPVKLVNGTWNEISFIVPDTHGAVIDEAGFMLESPSHLLERAFGKLYLDEFEVSGKAHYTIDFSKQATEFQSVTPFAHHKGKAVLENGKMKCTSGEECSSFTGNYYARDYTVSADVEPVSGSCHMMIFRAEGVYRHYRAGFDGHNKVSLHLVDFGVKKLVEVPFEWSHTETYRFEVTCTGSQICFSINDEKIFSAEDSRFASGMFGFSVLGKGEALLSNVACKEL